MHSSTTPEILRTASQTKSALYREVLKVCGTNPDAIKDKLELWEDSNNLVHLHHEALKETQDVVKGHLDIITNLQALDAALRERDHVRQRAAESVMEMFSTKCLCTVYASLLSLCSYQIIAKPLRFVLSEVANEEVLRTVECAIYLFALMVLVPPLQYRMAKKDQSGVYMRLHAALSLQRKGLPMILAWAFKDIVEALLQLTSGIFWDEFIAAIVLIGLTTALKHLPPVSRAKADLVAKPPKDSVKIRYLNMPDQMTLACGFAINQVFRFLVELLVTVSGEKLPAGAKLILEVVFQILYFVSMSMSVISWDAKLTRERALAQKLEKKATTKHDWVTATEMEIANGIGDTMTHALAFVYGWGVSDTLRVIYYRFFQRCDGWSSCDYSHVWYFAILTTFGLGTFIQRLSVQEYRSETSRSYRSLMTTAVSLTVGWAWMNVCESTTNFFVQEWEAYANSSWLAPVVYLLLLVFVYIIMTEVYFQILDEMRITKRERHEFYEAYPLLPSGWNRGVSGAGDGDSQAPAMLFPFQESQTKAEAEEKDAGNFIAL